jgi:hypothetical protein
VTKDNDKECKKQSFLKYLYKKHQESIDGWLSYLIHFSIPAAGFIICLFLTEFHPGSIFVFLGLVGLNYVVIKIYLEYSEYKKSVHAQSGKEISSHV